MRSTETLDKCLVREVCIDQYLWSVYQRTPKQDTVKVETLPILCASTIRLEHSWTSSSLIAAAVLIELEASGDAMRFVDANGRIAWKATPNLCQFRKDAELDSQDDLEEL